jgi:hypothetical protein
LVAWDEMVDVVDETVCANGSVVLSPVTIGFHPANGTRLMDAGMCAVAKSGAAILHPGDARAGALDKFRVLVELTDKLLGHVPMIALCPVPG